MHDVIVVGAGSAGAPLAARLLMADLLGHRAIAGALAAATAVAAAFADCGRPIN